jgi:hypothetical protein
MAFISIMAEKLFEKIGDFSMAELDVNVYPSFEGEYLVKLTIPDKDPFNKLKGSCETICIVDRSGSMGQQVARIINVILPQVLTDLGYSNEKIKIFMFDDKINIFDNTINEMCRYKIFAGGGTYMTKAIAELDKYFMTTKNNRVRIITLSDGDLNDQADTLQMTSQLSHKIKGININSQAIRFFTSNSQPDTRGLASVVQLNNINQAKLIDIHQTLDNEMTVKQIVQLFVNDGLDKSVKLTSKESILMNNPWSAATNHLNLSIGENTLWFKELPSELTLENCHVKLNLKMQRINVNQFETMIEPKLEQFLNKIKVLKIVNTPETKNEITQMMNYFNKLQTWLEQNSQENEQYDTNTMKGRLQYFKNIIARRKKSILQIIAQIANDDKVAQLNSAQQAEYLRKMDTTKTTKALARRALDAGIDFTEVLQKEVIQMHAHLDELKDIKNDLEYTSFISQGTTLEGIRAVCALIDEKILDDMEASDILQMINIVGVAANGKIGDYPDPMSWRVNNIYPGCYVSMSDVMLSYSLGNKKVYPPGFQKTPEYEITSVIPIFNDHRIIMFMRKYAPNMLEYSASIGMRKLIAGVNMTNGYTMVAGILKLIEELNNNKSTLTIETFVTLVKNYDIFAGKYFEHILEYVKDQDDNLTYFIANNGTTNMINPLYKLLKANNTKFTARILRSIYSFESYQILRRIVKKESDENRPKYIHEILCKLLGVDCKKYPTPITPLFENNPKPIHHDKYYIDQQLVDDITKDYRDTDYIVLIPAFLSAVNDSNPVAAIQKIPKLTDNLVCEVLQLPYDLKTFKFYSLVQSLLYPEKALRVDDEKFMMRINDLHNKQSAENMILEYLTKQYHDDYSTRRTHKKKEEHNIVMHKLIDDLINTNDFKEFCDLKGQGLTYKNINFHIVNHTSMGFVELKEKLLDTSLNVPLRSEKIYVFLTGKNFNGDKIWNGGNLLRIKLSEYEYLFEKFNGTEIFEKLKELYKLNPVHIYRDKINRHEHGNGKPSYWAYGWETLEKMYKHISAEEWKEYKEIHYNCCGIDQINY